MEYWNDGILKGGMDEWMDGGMNVANQVEIMFCAIQSSGHPNHKLFRIPVRPLVRADAIRKLSILY